MKLKASLLDEKAIKRSLIRISHEIIERNKGVEDVVLIGVERRGYPLALRIAKQIESIEKVELKVGKIIACEKHPDADKLLVSKIDVGNNDVRTIVSGIAGSYTPGQLIGKKVVVVTNLKPAKIKGIESQGMILAGKEGKVIEVVNINGLKEGTRIS